MKNVYCLDLNLGYTPDLDSTVEFFSVLAKDDRLGTFKILDSQQDQQLVAILDQLGLTVFNAWAFWIPPRMKQLLHIDGLEVDNHVKINFAVGNPKSEMKWWTPKKDFQDAKQDFIKYQHRGYILQEEDCDLVWSQTVGQPSLVKVGHFHSVDNSQSDTGRWAFAYVLNYKEGGVVHWDNAVEILSKYIDTEDK
jgi:hypothetical protein